MVQFWDAMATGLTHEEISEIERISHGYAWIQWNRDEKSYRGRFYYFPKNSGFELGDSPHVPKHLVKKVDLRDLEVGWLEDRTFTSVETVAGMFPKEMEKIWQKFKAEIGKKEHLT